MELISELMNDTDNTNRHYTHRIKESKYVQSCSQMDDSYSTINELFLSLYDPSFSLLPSKEKTFYMKQKLLQIATDIDEKSREKYERRTDLKAIKKGYGEGLIAFRKWVYK